MAGMKTFRLALWGLVGMAACLAVGLYAYGALNRTDGGFGAGDYRLETAAGVPFTRESFRGHPTALFFGFTHCPEVCPTTLAEMAGWFETLGADAKDLQAVFISVDPERDTPAVIGDYVAWTGHVTGVTGSRSEIDKAIAAWGVVAEKVPVGDDDYTINHTASVYLLDRNGSFTGTIAYREDSETAVDKLRRLIGS